MVQLLPSVLQALVDSLALMLARHNHTLHSACTQRADYRYNACVIRHCYVLRLGCSVSTVQAIQRLHAHLREEHHCASY